MKKVLLGLLALSAVSFAGVNTLEEARGDEMKFKTRNTTRLGRNRTEVELNNIKLGSKTYVDYEGTLDIYGDTYKNGSRANADQHFEHDLEVFHQLGDTGRWEMYINLESDTNGGVQTTYIDVMPTYNLYRGDKGFSLFRAGMGFQANKVGVSNDDALRFVGEFKNIYVMNDRVELEVNAYYTDEITRDGNVHETARDSKVELEAYAYFNYPLYEGDKVKVEALAEGGIDPYSFGERETGGRDSEEFKSKVSYDDNYVYVQPTVRATYTTEDNVSIWTEAGYYAERYMGTEDANTDDDGTFVQIGVSTKF